MRGTHPRSVIWVPQMSIRDGFSTLTVAASARPMVWPAERYKLLCVRGPPAPELPLPISARVIRWCLARNSAEVADRFLLRNGRRLANESLPARDPFYASRRPQRQTASPPMVICPIFQAAAPAVEKIEEWARGPEVGAFPDLSVKGFPRPTLRNTLVALERLGVGCSFDRFQAQTLHRWERGRFFFRRVHSQRSTACARVSWKSFGLILARRTSRTSALEAALGDMKGKMSSETIWEILSVQAG